MNTPPTIRPLCRPAECPPGAKSILVVEDFLPLCDLLVRHLSACGYHVLVANDAAGAQTIADAEGHIDVLLTDLVMPGRRGDELAARVASGHPETRIVLMGNEQPIGLALHGIGFLQKPFTLGALSAAVRSALASSVVFRGDLENIAA